MKIVSGGQTGVDRAALDFAIQQGCPRGGWCPLGRLAEDGIIPAQYPLRETDSPEYGERTEKNVLDSDATLIVTREKDLTGGTAFTHALALQHGRPVLVICETDGLRHGVSALSEFLQRNLIRTLNIAGPRESQAPALGEFVKELLETTFKQRKARSV